MNHVFASDVRHGEESRGDGQVALHLEQKLAHSGRLFCTNDLFNFMLDVKLGDAPCILGIDEAGRGPVLGPMVYGCCYCPKSKDSELREMGFADSKALTDEKRRDLLAKIQTCAWLGHITHVLPPQELSEKMLRRSLLRS